MKIKKLILETADIIRLEEFYGRVLNVGIQKNNGQLEISIGQTQLIFSEAKVGNPCYHFAINIPSNKLDEAKAWLIERVSLLWIEQYKSDIADFVNWNARSVYFIDPAGNILELIARFDLDNKSEESFSAKQFLSISEVGIVFPENEMDGRTEDLLHAFPVAYFEKQPPLTHFKAVGNDEGLFIIVPENRNWFPTAEPAGIFPLTVQFEINNKDYEIALLVH